MNQILTQLESAPNNGEFNDCMKQLGAQSLSGISAVTMDMSRLFFSATQTRMAQLRKADALIAEKESKESLDPGNWPLLASAGELAGLMGRQPDELLGGLHLRLLGQTGKKDSHNGYAGYDSHTIALSGGMDRMLPHGFLTDKFLAGISMGYADTDVTYADTGKSHTHIETYSMGIYGSWFDKNWHVDTTLAGARAGISQYSGQTPPGCPGS